MDKRTATDNGVNLIDMFTKIVQQTKNAIKN